MLDQQSFLEKNTEDPTMIQVERDLKISQQGLP